MNDEIAKEEITQPQLIDFWCALKLVRQRCENHKNVEFETIRRISKSLSISAENLGYSELLELTQAYLNGKFENVLDYTSKLSTILKEIAQQAELEKSKVLVVYSEEKTLEKLKLLLTTPDREVLIASTAQIAKDLLEEHEISILIVSLELSDADGRELLVEMKKRVQSARIPTLVLSRSQNKITQTECIVLGAEGYFEEPIDFDLLSTTVAEKLSLILSKNKETRQDALTNLPNQLAFAEAFQRIVAFLRRSREPLSIALLDFDNIDKINQTFGHAAGDKFLKEAAQVIANTLRTSDFLARWSSNKFVAYFPNTDNAGATLALEKAMKDLKKHVFDFKGETVTELSFTGGVAQIADRMTLEEAIARASHYRYLAQEEGSGKVQSQAKITPSVSKSRRVIVSPGKQLPLDAKVLLVEDQPIIANVLKYYLEREGFEIHHLPDGEAALDAVGNHKFTLIILDVKLPKMDGFELLQHFRKRPMLRHTPIVMLTSMGREKDIIRGFELGASDYILKPFSPAELLVRLRRLLEQAA